MNLICMSFDGDYVTECKNLTIEELWEHSNNIGSKWFFFPFHFITTTANKTIVDTPIGLEWLKGKRVKTVSKIFKAHSMREDMQNVDSEEFIYSL